MADEREADPGLRRDLTVALRELAWTIHRRAPERVGGPIPTTEIALLKQALETPGATVGELSQALGLRQSNASAALRGMEARGLIVRTPSETDRRIVHVRATPAGEAEHRSIAQAWVESVVVALSDLSREQVLALEDAIEAMRTLERALRRRPPGAAGSPES